MRRGCKTLLTSFTPTKAGPRRGPDISQGGHFQELPETGARTSADPLGRRSHSSRVGRLEPAKRERLARELNVSPASSGYAESKWSGALVAQHLLLRYGIRLGPRHCRRILANIGCSRPRDPRAQSARKLRSPRRESEGSGPWQSLPPLGMSADVRNKQIALKRIQRLCSAPLPMATLAMTLFDLVGDAIPHGDIRIMTADFENHRWLTNVDISSWGHTFSRLLDLPPEVQVIRIVRALAEETSSINEGSQRRRAGATLRTLRRLSWPWSNSSQEHRRER